MENKIKELSGEYNDAITGIAEYRTAITNFERQQAQILVCPACDAELKMDSDKLVKLTDKIENKDGFIEETVKLIEVLNTKQAKAGESSSFLRKVAAEVEELKKGLTKDPAPEYKDRLSIQDRR